MIPEAVSLMLDRVSRRDGDSELSLVMFLDAQSNIVGATLSEGDAGTVDLPIAAILRCCRALRCKQLLLVHTHPSGNSQPSRQDKTMTRRLSALLRREGQSLIDHIILTRGRYFSFRANGLL